MAASPTPILMKKIIWTFGLISGAIMALFMVVTLPFANALDEHSLILGYAGIVAGFLLVYFGVRSYRDNVLRGSIGFGRAFTVGILIAAIGSVCYVATWEIMYYKIMPDFYSKYAQSTVDQARKNGKSEAEIAKTREMMDEMTKNAGNPAWVFATTFIEPFPVGLLIALISAGILRRKSGAPDPILAAA
jgi:hypothetical protein